MNGQEFCSADVVSSNIANELPKLLFCEVSFLQVLGVIWMERGGRVYCPILFVSLQLHVFLPFLNENLKVHVQVYALAFGRIITIVEGRSLLHCFFFCFQLFVNRLVSNTSLSL